MATCLSRRGITQLGWVRCKRSLFQDWNLSPYLCDSPTREFSTQSTSERKLVQPCLPHTIQALKTPLSIRPLSSAAPPQLRKRLHNQRSSVNKLIDETARFIKRDNAYVPYFQLIDKWRHLLWQIAFDDKRNLHLSSKWIDLLVRSYLRKFDAESFSDGENRLLGNLSQAAEFVTLGVYAWGRMAHHSKSATKKAEGLRSKLNQLNESLPTNLTAPSNQELYSALAYCWSQSSERFHTVAPERAHYYLNCILANHDSIVHVATYNSVLRAYAKRGNIEEVRRLIESMPVEKDVYTYESIIEACFNSQHPEALQEALVAFRHGIQLGLKQKDVVPMAQLCSRFLNMNKNNPRVCGEVLDQLLTLQEAHPSVEILQSRHVMISMTAWAKQGKIEEVDRLFQLMRNLYDNGNQQFRLTYQVCDFLAGK